MTEPAYELTSSGGELRHLADEATVETLEDAADAHAAAEALAELEAGGRHSTPLAVVDAELAYRKS